MDFEHSNVLISGGSSGIGFALAQKFVSMGSNVTILARKKFRLLRAVTELKKSRISDHQKINWISADVSKYSILEKSIKTHGIGYDILINSAGLAYPGLFEELPFQIYKQLMEVNFLGTVCLTKLVLPHMISQSKGHIVNISSLAALIGIYGYTVYAPTKYAIRGFSKILRSELKPHGIHVSVVFPPDTDTPQLSFERSIMPEITRKINQGGGIMSAEQVATSIISGIKKKKFTILPGIEGKILYLFAPFFDRFFYHYSVNLASKKNK